MHLLPSKAYRTAGQEHPALFPPASQRAAANEERLDGHDSKGLPTIVFFVSFPDL